MKKTFQSPSLRTINVKAQSLMAASGTSVSGLLHNGKAGSDALVYGRGTAPAAGVWED